jgi:vancomycin permeability regulator SanA
MQRRRSLARRLLLWLLAAVGGASLLVGAASLFVEVRYRDRMESVEALDPVPHTPVAIVFGAGLAAGNEPSPMLAERLDAAIALRRAGKVQRLLLSGDSSDRYHDETAAMRRYLLARGIAAEELVDDPAGLSTYDSCFRARAVFGLNRALLVTQDYHLPRALYIANSIGLDARGAASDKSPRPRWKLELREALSRSLAFLWVLIEAPPAELGPPRPIALPPG